MFFISIFSTGCYKIEGLSRDQDNEFRDESKIQFSSISTQKVKELKKLSKVWGVVKYYHPESTSGNINMDYELFRIIPSILKEDSDANKILYEWVKGIGENEIASQDQKQLNNDLIQLSPSTEWCRDRDYLGENLSYELTKLLNPNISDRKNAYAHFQDDEVYVNMENEEPYYTMKPEDTGYRLLGLFRYWNIIEYYYPYMDIIEEDWNQVLEEFIPKFIEGTDYKSYVMAIGELTTKIHDTHASVTDKNNNSISTYFGDHSIPASFVEIDNQIVITKANTLSELKNGDILLSIDHKNIENIMKETRKYISQSREDNASSLYLELFRTFKLDVDVTVIREGKQLDLNVKTSLQKVYGNIDTKSQKMKDGQIYYINAGLLKDGEITKIMKTSSDVDGLILDMRNYPSSFITYELAEFLIPSETEFALVSAPDPTLPGQFYYLDPLISGQIKDKENSTSNGVYKGKLVILMDENTISQGEFTIMSLRNAEGSIVLGRESGGVDGNVVVFKLPGNVTTRISGLGVYYPDKSQTQRIGIKPDLYLDPTIDGIREGRDEFLEKAIEIIESD